MRFRIKSNYQRTKTQKIKYKSRTKSQKGSTRYNLSYTIIACDMHD